MNNKLTTREKRLLYILLCFCIFTAGIYFLISPSISNNLELSEQRDELSVTEAQMQMTLASYESRAEFLTSLQQSTETLYETFYPLSQDEFSDRLVTNLALKHSLTPLSLSMEGIQFLPVTPYLSDGENQQPTDSSGGTDAAPFFGNAYICSASIAVSGSQANFTAMMDELNRYPQVIIRDFSVGTNVNDTQTFTFTAQVLMVESPPL